MGKYHDKTFPNETSSYREARDELIDAEINLRKEVEKVAQLRRNLPLGGEIKEDYIFEGPEGETISLSKLFKDGKDTLFIYNFMFPPEADDACPYCTSLVDGFDGGAEKVLEKINMVVVPKSSFAKFKKLSLERRWNKLTILSSLNNNYNRDYFGEDKDGGQWPVANIFKKVDGKIYHTYNSELIFASSEDGQEPRHVDMLWPLWNILDLTPGGRG